MLELGRFVFFLLAVAPSILQQRHDSTASSSRSQPRVFLPIIAAAARANDSVRIAGRVTFGGNAFSYHKILGYIQDGTAAAVLTGDSLAAPLEVGDSVEVTGVSFGSRSGTPRIEVGSLRRVPVAQRPPVAVVVSLSDTALRAHVGRLVTVTGRVLAMYREYGDELLTLANVADSTMRLTIESEDDLETAGKLSRFGPGDVVAATGVLTLREGSESGEASYRLYVRGRSDANGVGITAQQRRYLLAGGAAAALIVILWLVIARLYERRMQRRLAQAHSQLHATYEVASDAILVLAENWSVVAVNPAAAALFGRTRAALVGGDVRQLLCGEDCYCLDAADLELASSGHVDREIRVSGTDGKTIALKLRLTAIDVAGRRRMVAVLRDVTGEMRTEAELHGVFAAMTDVVLVFGRNGEYLKIPTTAANGLFAPSSEILGRNVRDILPPKEAEDVCAVIRAALASADPVAYEYSLPFPDRVVWFSASVTRLDDDAVVWVARDITAERAGAEALRKSETRYRLLFENNPAPMWVFAEDTLAFLAVNSAAVAHYGYSRDEFLRMTLLDIRPPEDIPEFLAVRQQAAADPRHYGVYRHRRKEGSLIQVEIVTHATEFDGRRARLVLVNDVTERQSLEQQLRQSQKIEAVGLLAGGVAHDFNNILTVIRGHTDFLLDVLETGDTRRDDAEEIRKAATRAAGLTHQLLAFSRKQILKPVVLNLNDVIAQMHTMLARVIGEDIEIVTRLSSTLGAVQVDPSQMEQVLINLAVNARDAMPKGGTLSIATFNVELDERAAVKRPGLAPGRYVRVSVSDTGSGMSEHVQAHLFEPFFTTKEVGRGTGLGLSTVHGIVTQSGGYISVQSAVDLGTTFEILLPRAQPTTTASEQRVRPVTPPHGTETVLLVEDQAEVRTLARRVLHRQGYVVLEAQDGPEALAVADRHDGAIDLVLTDAVMPTLSGSEVVRELQARRPDVKVLFMSGYTEDEIIRRDISTGAEVLLEKPFTIDALAHAVRKVLDGGGDETRERVSAA